MNNGASLNKLVLFYPEWENGAKYGAKLYAGRVFYSTKNNI